MVIDSINKIDALDVQIQALLDMMMCCDEDSVDIKSIKMVSEMAITMYDEMMVEVKKLVDELRSEVATS